MPERTESSGPIVARRATRGRRAAPAPLLAVASVLASLMAGCAAFEDPMLRPFPAPVSPQNSARPADYDARLAGVTAALPEGVTLACAPPFIVVGDRPRGRLLTIACRVALPAADAYRRQFFARGPRSTIVLWLPSSTEAYGSLYRRVCGRAPPSVLGVFDPRTRTLWANPSAGYGWICHELFHALAEEDFGAIPVWLDEGIASLYEAPRFEDGRILGGENWRGWVLAQYRAVGQFVPLARLTRLTFDEFYAEPQRGLHYAEAQSFCLFLQDQGCLEGVYKALRTAQAQSRPPDEALCAAAGRGSLDALQAAWLRWLEGR